MEDPWKSCFETYFEKTDKVFKVPRIRRKCPDLISRNFLNFRDGVENIMTDNVKDKTKETAYSDSNERSESYEDAKSAVNNTYKTAGVEGQKGVDEVKKTEVTEPSEIKGGIKRPRMDFG